EAGRYVEDRQRPGVMESAAQRQPVLRLVDELLAEGMGDSQAASAADLPAKASRVDDGPDVADAEVVDERDGAGFHVDLDLREADHERRAVAVAGVIFLPA